MNVFIGEPVDVEIVEVDELPPVPGGRVMTNPEYPSRWADEIKKVFDAVLDETLDPNNKTLMGAWGTALVALYLLFDRTPKADIESCIERLVSRVSGDTTQARLQAIQDVVVSLLKTPAKPAVHKIPTTTGPFDDTGAAPVGNSPPCHVLFEAVAKGGPNARKQVNGWKGRDNNPEDPVFRNPQRVSGDWTVYFDPQTDSPIAPWGRVEGLSALHTKLGLFCLAKICDPRNEMRYPNKEPVGVSYEDLRRALGLREMPMAEFKPLADRLVKDWADLKATVRGVMINGKPDGIAECSLFVVSKVWNKQFAMFEERVQIGWLFDPGPWAKHYFNRGAKPWVATLHQAILDLDHRGVRRADILALHIATLLFVVAGGDHFQKRAITRTVAELLEVTGELPEPQQRGAHWANRTAEALHVALETLQSMKLVATVEFGPKYPDPGERGKGWVERWLNATITLTTPEAAAFLGRDIPEPTAKLPARLERKRQARKPGKAQPGERLDNATAARLRARIAQRFPNQRAAADYFGCSQPFLSLVANQRRGPGDFAAKIRAFLDSPMEGDHE